MKLGLLVHRERMVSEDALKALEEKPAAAIVLTSYGVPNCCSGTPHYKPNTTPFSYNFYWLMLRTSLIVLLSVAAFGTFPQPKILVGTLLSNERQEHFLSGKYPAGCLSVIR